MKTEEIIPFLGNFGRYQFLALLYVSIVGTIGCMVSFGNVFFAAETDHWCKVLPAENCSSWLEFQDNCTDVKKSVLLPPPEREDSKYAYSNCKQWDSPAGYVFDPYMPLGQVDNASAVACKDGWEYDRSQYKTTTIMEVRTIHAIISPETNFLKFGANKLFSTEYLLPIKMPCV